MVSCAILMCPNRTGRTIKPGLSYHQIPKNLKMRALWLASVGRKDWEPGPRTFICSEHFNEEDINRTYVAKVVLRDGVVPTVFKKRYLHPTKNLLRRKLKGKPREGINCKQDLIEPEGTLQNIMKNEETGETIQCTTSKPKRKVLRKKKTNKNNRTTTDSTEPKGINIRKKAVDESCETIACRLHQTKPKGINLPGKKLKQEQLEDINCTRHFTKPKGIKVVGKKANDESCEIITRKLDQTKTKALTNLPKKKLKGDQCEDINCTQDLAEPERTPQNIIENKESCDIIDYKSDLTEVQDWTSVKWKENFHEDVVGVKSETEISPMDHYYEEVCARIRASRQNRSAEEQREINEFIEKLDRDIERTLAAYNKHDSNRNISRVISPSIKVKNSVFRRKITNSKKDKSADIRRRISMFI